MSQEEIASDLFDECARQRDRIAELEAALMQCRALAQNELDRPSGLHETCLSLIAKAADNGLSN